jgi:hypothetical protein
MIGWQIRRIIAREARRLFFNQSSSMIHRCIFFRVR